MSNQQQSGRSPEYTASRRKWETQSNKSSKMPQSQASNRLRALEEEVKVLQKHNCRLQQDNTRVFEDLNTANAIVKDLQARVRSAEARTIKLEAEKAQTEKDQESIRHRHVETAEVFHRRMKDLEESTEKERKMLKDFAEFRIDSIIKRERRTRSMDAAVYMAHVCQLEHRLSRFKEKKDNNNSNSATRSRGSHEPDSQDNTKSLSLNESIKHSKQKAFPDVNLNNSPSPPTASNSGETASLEAQTPSQSTNSDGEDGRQHTKPMAEYMKKWANSTQYHKCHHDEQTDCNQRSRPRSLMAELTDCGATIHKGNLVKGEEQYQETPDDNKSSDHLPRSERLQSQRIPIPDIRIITCP